MNAEVQPNRYAPPEAQVSDYVDADAPLELASRGARFGAAMIDGVIGMIIFLPAIVMGALSAQGMGGVDALLGVWGAIMVIAAIAWGVITYVLVKRNGQTIGKKMVGVKVVRKDGSRASVARIFWLRNVVNGIPGAIPVLGYVYVLVDHLLIFSESRQCVHDKIADTVVVNA